MASRKRGLGDTGRERLRKNWEDIESGSSTPSWVVGAPSEKYTQGVEEVEEFNQDILRAFATTSVISIPEPDYYRGPEMSTRVIKHRFVPNRTGKSSGTTGTAYIKFGGTRKNGNKKRENTYEYYDVPASVYLDFVNSGSKGQTIDVWTRNYTYKKIDDDSVFVM